MTRSEAITRLEKHRIELQALHVHSLAVFGSVARGEAGPNSDVDLLVEFSAPVGLFEFLEVKERLEEILETNVDLVTRDGLKPQLRDQILQEAIRAAQAVAAAARRYPEVPWNRMRGMRNVIVHE